MGRNTDFRLQELARRLALWRRTRPRGARIPDALWREASSLAEELGISKVATTLRMDYYSLQRRLSAVPSASPPSGFVELSGSSLLGLTSSSTGAVIEVRASDGAQLTLRLPIGTTFDVAALIEAFWSSRS